MAREVSVREMAFLPTVRVGRGIHGERVNFLGGGWSEGANLRMVARWIFWEIGIVCARLFLIIFSW